MNLDASDLTYETHGLVENWYLNNETGYSGPFSHQEILQFIKRKKIAADTLIWRKDLSGWKALSEIETFETPLSEAAAALDLPNKQELSSSLAKDWVDSDEFWSQIRSQYQFQSDEFNEANDRLPQAKEVRARSSRAFAIGLIGSILVVIFFAFDFSKVLADIPDISKEESREIKAAISESLKASGPAAAIGLIAKEIGTPTFVVGSNLPDSTELKMSIHGIPETLVGRFEVLFQAKLNLKGGLARTQKVFIQPNQSNIPMGEYRVIVSLDNKKLTEKTYFLGGEKNLNYDLSLRKYHERLREKARAELLEIKQMNDTIEKQLTDLSAQFETVSHSGKNSIASWKTFDEKWQPMQAQIADVIRNLEARQTRGEIFYFQLFDLLKKVENSVGLTHDLQVQYITAVSSSSATTDVLEERVAQQSALAQSTLLALRTREIEVENLPLLANGMPRTE